MTISKKLYILIAIPFIAVVLLSAIGIISQMNTVKQSERLNELITLSTNLSAYVHEMQKERGATGVFTGSNGQTFQVELSEQRALTDGKLQELNTFLKSFDASSYGAEFYESLQEAIEQKDQLQSHREAVDSFSINDSEATGYYSTHN
ncbi:hypothetical protein F9U64_09720 [Gracilibacillus oryzae]|uniref:Nitrate/nitrite sensing protein domain-containing protein n=1 Tax=Gracilibacillus oryzae TaxID=1672701 RepID=A0A7C8GU79_9BACI|nr:hypothetical protein F9U64_09720 [Gracilibacillus oryzae]